MKTLRYAKVILMYSLIYLALAESIGWGVWAMGLVLSALAVLLSESIMVNTSYLEAFSIPFGSAIRYFLYLLVQIYRSGIAALKNVIRGNERVTFTIFRSSLDNGFYQNLLANAITLTPGTVTVERNGAELTVLSYVDEETPTLDTHAIKTFERLLKGGMR